MDMPDEKKRPPRVDYWRETFFLPPLKMILSFFDKDTHQKEPEKKDAEKHADSDEKTVARLIEKFSEKEE
jgi:hypothetical protein